MYVIGLTGGVGSGKTAAAGKLAELVGAKLLIADELGHVVMEKGAEGYHKIVDAFGSRILDNQGNIDRKMLSGIVFGNPESLERLNEIVHPAVKSYLKEYIDRRRKETGCDELCDEVWYVYVPPEVRMERLAVNRGYTEEKSMAIMQQQLAEEEFRKRCKHEIWNGGSVQELENGIRELCKSRNF